jgi:hypothetical protein
LLKTDPAAPPSSRRHQRVAGRPAQNRSTHHFFSLSVSRSTNKTMLFNCSLGKLAFYCACTAGWRVSQRSNYERINAAKLNFPLIKFAENPMSAAL